jgi:phosphotransferase system  glucose/maltose/N-acetylglucosamine-specific IIC component
MPIKYALTMLVYAVCLLISGFVTMSVAPPGSKPATAFIIPAIAAGLAIAAAVLSLMIKSNRKLGMIGIHVGLVLPLIFAAGSVSRVAGSMANAKEFNTQLSDMHTALAMPAGEVTLTLVNAPDSDRARDRLMQARWMDGETPRTMEPRHPWRPSGYQSVGMISIAMLSVLAFVSLLLHRPEIPKAEPKPDLLEDES